MPYYSNALTGPQGGGDFDIYRVNTNQQYVLGSKISRGDGAAFRYCSFSAAVTHGGLVAQDISATGAADGAMIVIAPASATNTSDGTIGSKFIQITGTATAGQFSGGILVIMDETGEGFSYSIKGNTATGNPVSGDYRLELHDPLQLAVAADSQTQITGSLYGELVLATAATDTITVGVACKTFADGEFGWIQTEGMVGVLTDVAGGIGDKMTLSDGTAGACQLSDSETEPAIGFVAQAGAITEYSTIVLQLN